MFKMMAFVIRLRTTPGGRLRSRLLLASATFALVISSQAQANETTGFLAAGAHIGPWITEVKPAPQIVQAGAWNIAVVKPAKPAKPAPQHAMAGIASYYWQDQMTATGERFDKSAMTAAHPTLPFGSLVKVRRPGTDHSVVVRINDRGPFKPGRVIDLSEAAAQRLNMTSMGLAPVELELLP